MTAPPSTPFATSDSAVPINTDRPSHGPRAQRRLKLTAKTGFVIAESTGEAHFKVTLKWTLGGS